MIRILLTILTLTFSLNTQAWTDNIDVVVGLAKPPYIIEEQGAGFEIDLVSDVLEMMELTPTFLYVPLGRDAKSLKENVGQAVLTVNENIVPNQKMRTAPYIIYQNVAITLKSDEIRIGSISQLEFFKVAAFQMANQYLGEEYEETVSRSNQYLEVPNQFRQVKLLVENKVDVLIMDINIFNYYFELIDGNLNDIEVHYIFPPNPYSLAFSDTDNVDRFNQMLERYKKSGRYDELLNKYNLQSQ